MTRRHSVFGSAALSAVLVAAVPAVAQEARPDSVESAGSAPSVGDARTSVYAEVSSGGELERYLRVLQLAGDAGHYPWSIRRFSPRELTRFGPADSTEHPWSARYSFQAPAGNLPSISVVRPSSRIIYNSAFPYGINDGPVWAGRGFTVAASFGFAAKWGPLSLAVVPEAFSAANAHFELAETGYPGVGEYASPVRPAHIDLPQRFGSEPYARIDPGESYARLDLPVISMGFSTAAQHWGPAADHPIILGRNAGGYPHLFLGTSEPLDLKIARLHGRLVWGALAHSDYVIRALSSDRRFMSGIVAVAELPVRGLELGFSRFYHTIWPADGLNTGLILAPIDAFLKNRTTRGPEASNQLASAFVRWAFPSAGFEVYGEFGREDHNWNFRDFLLEPDHISSYMMGFQRVWNVGGERVALRAETLNTQASALSQVRWQSRVYTHSGAVQGHTHRGQALGSGAGLGGGATSIALDLYHPGGRWTLGGSRLLNEYVPPPGESGQDVAYSVDAGALVFRGDLDLEARTSLVYNLNRNYAGDAFNLNVSVGLTWLP